MRLDIVSLAAARQGRALMVAGVARSRERPTIIGVPRDAAGQALPALDAAVNESRIELDHAGAASSPFRCDQRGPSPAERIEDHTATVGAVADGIGDHGHRLDGRVRGKPAFHGTVQRAPADIVPNVRPMPAMAPKRYIVNVRALSDLKHENELVLGSIEQTHTCVSLVPDAQVF